MNNKLTVIVVATLIVGAGAGYWLGQSASSGTASSAASSEAERKPLYYRHPMNPGVTSPVPAKGSMGMDYTPVFADDADPGEVAGTVRIDSVVQQNIGVRTAKAEFASLNHTVRAVGRISYDEKRITQLHPKIEGWIEELFVDTTGEQVEEGHHPSEPVLAQTSRQPAGVRTGTEKQRDSEEQPGRRHPSRCGRTGAEFPRAPGACSTCPNIRSVNSKPVFHAAEKRCIFTHPSAGIVTQIGASEGQHVSPATELYHDRRSVPGVGVRRYLRVRTAVGRSGR